MKLNWKQIAVVFLRLLRTTQYELFVAMVPTTRQTFLLLYTIAIGRQNGTGGH